MARPEFYDLKPVRNGVSKEVAKRLSPCMFLHAERKKGIRVTAESGFLEADFAYGGGHSHPGKCLWKLLFGRHSQICLKVALWML